MSVKIPALFDLRQTLDCGQAFRWKEFKDGSFAGFAGRHALVIEKQGDEFLLTCDESEYDSFWKNYFDLEEDYGTKYEAIVWRSPVLREAAEKYPGIRILRQDPWEALCSFIISQNNNIPRIKKIIEVFCLLFGEKTEAGFAFPTAERVASLSIKNLELMHCGYRADYIITAAKAVANGEIDFEKISALPADYGREALKSIRGVGPKVAECTLLYGFHKTECFPMDVWMKRAMRILLPDIIPGDFGENAGLAQQIIFHYCRMHPNLVK